MATSTLPQAWEMVALRNRRGVHTVEGVDPFGRPFAEPISVAAAAARDWSNPPEEIRHMREMAAWLAENGEERRILRVAHLPRNEGAFTHPGVVLQHAEDYGPGYWHEDDVGCCQSEDGPLHLVIGRRASDDKLQRAAEQFGLEVETLRGFRDAEAHHG